MRKVLLFLLAVMLIIGVMPGGYVFGARRSILADSSGSDRTMTRAEWLHDLKEAFQISVTI